MRDDIFAQKAEQIQVNLASGLKALNQIQQVLTDELEPNNWIEALYVVDTYLQTVYSDLEQWVSCYISST